MKFGVSTWLWISPFDGESMFLFKKIKEMGFDTIEIPVEDPQLIEINTLKEFKNKNDLNVTVCGAFGPGRDLTHNDPLVVHTCMNYIKDCLDIAAELGCTFFAGPMYSEVGKARMVPIEQRELEWDRAVSNLRDVCVMADDKGLDIAIEPLNRFESDLVNNARDVKKLIKDINHPRAKICLDGFHMAIEEQNILQAIITAGEDLIHVQVSENYRGTPGTGTTNWNDIKMGLEQINYQGNIVIESFTPDNKNLAEAVCIWKPLAESQDKFAQDGLNFLKKLFVAHPHGK